MVKTTKKWAGPPMKKRAPKPAPAPEGADTQERIIADMIALCEHVDEQMAEKRNAVLHWNGYQQAVQWKQLEQEADKLRQRLRKLVMEQRDPDGRSDYDEARKITTLALIVERGTVPPWSRPGYFIEWLGETPIVCDWGGYLYPHVQLFPANPARAWLHPEGYLGNTRLDILPEMETVRDLFRASLLNATKDTARKGDAKVSTFAMYPLNPRGLQIATRMAAEPWVQKALREQPALPPIPMPGHVRSVQLSL
jgi:hypothetical protein